MFRPRECDGSRRLTTNLCASVWTNTEKRRSDSFSRTLVMTVRSVKLGALKSLYFHHHVEGVIFLGPTMKSKMFSTLTVAARGINWIKLQLTFSTDLRFVGLSFNFGPARARGQQHCLPHHERLLSSWRKSDGPHLYTRNEGNGEFLFHASGRHPKASTSTKSAVAKLHVPQTLRTTWPPLHRMRCSPQSSRNRAHQQDMAVSFPLPSGENRTTTHRTLLTHLHKANLVLRVRSSGCMCLSFFFRHSTFFSVWSESEVV